MSTNSVRELVFKIKDGLEQVCGSFIRCKMRCHILVELCMKHNMSDRAKNHYALTTYYVAAVLNASVYNIP